MKPMVQMLSSTIVPVLLYVFCFSIELVIVRKKRLNKFLDRLKRMHLDLCFVGLSLIVAAISRTNLSSQYYIRYPPAKMPGFLLLYLLLYVIAASLAEHAGELERTRTLERGSIRVRLVIIHSLLVFLAGIMFITGCISIYDSKGWV